MTFVNLVLLALLGLSGPAVIAPERLVDWYKADHIEVRVQVAGAPDSYSATFDTAANGDTRILVDSSVPGQSGTILLISGRWMATKDVVLQPGAEIDAMDMAALQVQTVLALLTRAFPNGPGTLESTNAVEIHEKETPIHVATSSASGTYRAPWALRGDVKRDQPSTVRFDLTFTAPGQADLKLQGMIQSRTPRFELPAAFSLIGWSVHSIGPSTETADGTSILDYGARSLEHTYRTIGELRAQSLMRIK